MKATIACVSGSLAGPVPAYCPSPGCADRTPPQREIAIQVDLIRVVAILRGLPVGVHRVDEPPLDVRRELSGLRTIAQLFDDRDAAVLVAVDHADHEHPAATGRPEPVGHDRADLRSRFRAPCESAVKSSAGAGVPAGSVLVVVVLVVVEVLVVVVVDVVEVLVVVDDGAVRSCRARRDRLHAVTRRKQRIVGGTDAAVGTGSATSAVDRSADALQAATAPSNRMVAARSSRWARGFTSS